MSEPRPRERYQDGGARLEGGEEGGQREKCEQEEQGSQAPECESGECAVRPVRRRRAEVNFPRWHPAGGRTRGSGGSSGVQEGGESRSPMRVQGHTHTGEVGRVAFQGTTEGRDGGEGRGRRLGGEEAMEER